MISLWAVVVLCLSCAALGSDAVDFVAKECMNSPYFKLLKFDLKTHPLVVPGTVKADLKFQILKLPKPGQEYELVAEVKRNTFALGYVHVPCFLGHGSCTHDFCNYIETKSKELAPDGKCSKKFPCSCSELKPKIYDIPDFEINVLNKHLPSLPFGLYTDYHATLKFVEKKTHKPLACLYFEFELKKPKCDSIFCWG